ncbi:Putative peptidoglycan-recognition protein [Halyomorpha halys]|nr:peptidoglycan-recognition protein SB2-like [Halyomorpha halys]KAE8573357.1 Putative peptidoglycan-recognition protein [Halyomorpha halys]
MISDTPIILNFTEALQTRQQWSKSNSETPCQLLIDHPARYVVIGHTVSLPCRTSLACETMVIQIQNDHRNRGRCDISYNFVIGDDGYIYEGRGWSKIGINALSFSCSSLGIGLVGNFNLNEPSDIMINSLKLLLKEGVNLGQISSTYKLIAHSQLNNWGSPGIHVEELIKKWDHWSTLTKEDCQCPNTSDI